MRRTPVFSKHLALFSVLLAVAILFFPLKGSGEDAASIKPSYPNAEYLYRTIDGAELISGKYPYSSAIGKVFEKLPEMRTRAFTNLETRLGVKYADKMTISIRIEDIGIKEAQGGGILMAQRITEGASIDERIVIRLFTEYIMMDMVDSQTELNHELTHAVMREVLGLRGYGALPKWFREGTAIYCASQGEEKMDVILSSLHSNNPRDVINGLEGKTKHNFQDYMEDYLVFEYIEKKFSSDHIKKIVDLVLNGGKNYKEALKEVLEMDFTTFEAEADKYAMEQATNWYTKHPTINVFFSGKKEYSSKKYADALTSMQTVAKQEKNPYLLALAQYYIARSLDNLKRTEEAIEYYEKVQKKAKYTNFTDRCFYYPALAIYFKLIKDPGGISSSDFARCEKGFLTVIRNLPYSQYAETSANYLGVMYKKMSFFEQAIKAFSVCLESFPKTKLASGCHLSIAECYLELGNKDLAFKHALIVLKGDNETMANKARKLLDKLH